MPKSTAIKRAVAGPKGSLELRYVDGSSDVMEGPLEALQEVLANARQDPAIREGLDSFELREGQQVRAAATFIGGHERSPVVSAITCGLLGPLAGPWSRDEPETGRPRGYRPGVH